MVNDLQVNKDMKTMKKFRVEAFIIPSNTKNNIESNQIDDVKLAIKLKDQSFNSEENLEIENTNKELNETIDVPVNFNNKLDNEQHNDNNEQYSSEFSEIFFETNEHIYDEIILPENKDKKEVKSEENNVNVNNNNNNHTEYTKAFFQIEEPIYDEPFVGNLFNTNLKNNGNNNYDVPQSRWALATSKFRRFGIVAPKLPKRSSSLKSITEDIEHFDDTLQEMYYNKYKNCSVLSTERPEDISEEIFRENWMQRLDSLRKLETLLKDKEVALQSRERLLFKKEKDLRILERLVKDKMKQAELYAKRYKKSLSSENILNNDRNLESRSSNSSNNHAKSEGITNTSDFLLKANSKILQVKKDEQVLKILPSSKNSVTTDKLSNKISMRSRSRPRQKIRYDDFDSTLSADIGDSSFIVTSRKFDPMSFKKPTAFIRSASERRPRVEQQISASRFINLQEIDKHMDGFRDTMEEKTLRKISENILATQDQETKFLNYGLIDEKALINKKNINKNVLANQKRFTHLGIESTNKTNNLKVVPKDRPVSWSEDTDDWLKKKRQAYNLATKNKANQNIAEKENVNTYSKANKPVKNTIKKDNRKRFSLFR